MFLLYLERLLRQLNRYNVVVFLYETIAAARSCAVAPLPRPEGDASTGTNVSISMPPPLEGNDNETVDPAPPTTPKEDAEIANVDVATYRLDVEAQEEEGAAVPPMPPPPAVKVVMVMAGKKLMKVPSTYASFLGLLWSLISFR